MKIVICGATGNIGQQAIDVSQRLGHQIVGITFNKQVNEGKKIVKQLKIPYFLCHSDLAQGNTKEFNELLTKAKPNLVVNAVVGTAGLSLSIQTIKARIDLGLANKESLVVGGWWLMQLAQKQNVKIYPIDSEHAALYELLMNQKNSQIKQLMVTASGGPFWDWSKTKLKNVTVKQATDHPTWSMGAKISIDSATMVNKAFELIEAFHLFKIKDVVAYRHKQSIIHAGVQLKSNVWLFHAAFPDMRLPIGLCLERYKTAKAIIKPLELKDLTFSFETIKISDYPVIKIAYDIIAKPKTSRGVVFNVVNDFASELFQKGLIRFDQIIDLINNFYWKYNHKKIETIVGVLALINKLQINLQTNWKEYL
ncbi:NAD-dependent epimerase/dehydratase family protein [[Mycoplasma] testudinis]|uniref:NAD-dependent epimerase/dehydratase family protein n=1 Tax=[Mycoplasma] testudinis TaxID=33924 RepID=UPI0004889C49|nr:NAD-dependent epimerase/dehydratase family protein [[Mycoplasma] testudinis]